MRATLAYIACFLGFSYTSKAAVFFPYDVDVDSTGPTSISRIENSEAILDPKHEKRQTNARSISIENIVYNKLVNLLLAPVSLGTPPQKHWAKIQLDGINIFGVPVEREPDFNCTQFGSFYDICAVSELMGTYSPNESSSYQNLTRDSGDNEKYKWWYRGTKTPGFNSSGSWATDNFHIGGETIQKFTFQLSQEYTAYNPVFSLGPSDNTTGSVSIIDQLSNSKTIEAKAISVYLNDWRSNSSEIEIGGVDKSKYEGDLLTLKAYRSTSGLRTLVSLNSITHDDGKTNTTIPDRGYAELGRSSEPLIAAVDWTLLVSLFKKSLGIVDAIVKSTGAIERTDNTRIGQTYKYYICDCNQANITPQTLTFNFTSNPTSKITKLITLDLSQLLMPHISMQGVQTTATDGTPLCRLMMEEINDKSDHDLILGTSFFRAAYVVQDFGNMEISIAQSIHNFTATSNKKKDVVVLKKGGVSDTPGLAVAKEDTNNIKPKDEEAKDPSAAAGNGNSDNSSKKKSAVIGSAVAGVAVLVSAVALIFFWRRRVIKRKQQAYEKAELPSEAKDVPQLDGMPYVKSDSAYAHEMPVPTELPPPPVLPGPPKPISELSSNHDR